MRYFFFITSVGFKLASKPLIVVLLAQLVVIASVFGAVLPGEPVSGDRVAGGSTGLTFQWMLLGLAFFFIFLLFRQNGRLLWQIEALEERLADGKPANTGRKFPSLPVGVAAPLFQAEDLKGNSHQFGKYLGKPRVVLFFAPGCGHCTGMIPELAKLDERASSQLILVTAGDPELNRRFLHPVADKFPILIQREAEVSKLYQIVATPLAYQLDADGKIAGEPAVGPAAILQLLGSQEKVGTTDDRKPSLAKSKINRNGLAAGTEAPHFELPLLSGETVSPKDFRGRYLLMVFSDPQCGPCQKVAPELDRIHREVDGVEVLIISRRDIEANQKKVTELGLSLPVALQKSWEISKLYGIFATPVGYLINPEGTLVKGVARGAEEIEGLVSLAVESSSPEDASPLMTTQANFAPATR
jgi:peroxiredoxin